MSLISEPMGRVDRARCSPASSVLMVSSLLGSLRPILLKEYMRMLYTEAGCKSTMLAWLMVGEMLRVDCLKSQESGERKHVGPGTLAGCGEINRLVPARRSRPTLSHALPPCSVNSDLARLWQR